MTKIRTASHLQELLDDEFSWRLKELHDIRSAARAAAGATSQKTFIRAGVALLYAHWEGFVKAGADAYVNYLSCSGLRHTDLRSCFIALALKRHIHGFLSSTSSAATVKTLEVIVAELAGPARLPIRNSVDTRSNLSSVVFTDILGWLGFNEQQYSTKFHLIDEGLLRRRNAIAHGNYLELEEPAFSDLMNQVVQLLRWFKTDIENALVTQAFVKSPGGASQPS